MDRHIAIVTGASHGLGVHIARALAARNNDLLLVARSEADLGSVARELGRGGRSVAYAAIDLARPDAAERVVAAAAALGPIDILVNNAAVELQRRFHTLAPQEIEAVIRLDLITPLTLTRALLPSMLARRFGRIVNISSIAGHVGFPFSEAYAACKDGLIAFSRVLRNDYRAAGVSASSIILGPVKGDGFGQRTLDEFGLTGGSAGLATPEQVAKAVVDAIEKDKSEIVVMPGPGRLMKALLDLFPGMGPAMTRMSGGDVLMARIAELREARAVRE
jgi:short-subunit dehydrogenase